MLILAMGANDGLRGIPTKTLEKNLNDTIELAKTNKLQVVLVGMMMPPNYGEDYRKNFQKVYKDLAKKHSVEFIPFLLNGVAGDKSLNQEITTLKAMINKERIFTFSGISIVLLTR